MKCNADRLIKALITAQLHEQRAIERGKAQQTWEKSKTPVVTVSRGYGALGREVAQLLADTLEVRCCDRVILQEVARRADVEEDLVRVLDQHIAHIDKHWWEPLLNRSGLSVEEFYRHLVKTVLSISLRGGVIIGRGANLILGPGRAFRVRIIGSPAECARRVAEWTHTDIDTARERVHDIDRKRAEYVRTLYQTDIDDPQAYDLIINSDRYDQVQMVEIILVAMLKAGYQLADDVFESLVKLT